MQIATYCSLQYRVNKAQGGVPECTLVHLQGSSPFPSFRLSSSLSFSFTPSLLFMVLLGHVPMNAVTGTCSFSEPTHEYFSVSRAHSHSFFSLFLLRFSLPPQFLLNNVDHATFYLIDCSWVFFFYTSMLSHSTLVHLHLF